MVVNATIDNLLKGAATQCLRMFLSLSLLFLDPTDFYLTENMNLALGYGEYDGIPLE